MDELLHKVCYVSFLFDDGTRQTIKTTLNKDILKTYGVTAREGYLFDISHSCYVMLRNDAVSVVVSDDKPESRGELDTFGDRFI